MPVGLHVQGRLLKWLLSFHLEIHVLSARTVIGAT